MRDTEKVAASAGLEPRGEGGGVLVLHLAHLAADRRGTVPDDRTERQRPLLDLDRQVAAGHRDDRAAEVFGLVDDVAPMSPSAPEPMPPL